MQPIRIATYNVHKCVGLDRRCKPSRIAEVIHDLKPDIVALQEVLSIDGGTRDQHQAQFLADELGMELALGDVRQLRGGLYGGRLWRRHPRPPSPHRRGC